MIDTEHLAAEVLRCCLCGKIMDSLMFFIAKRQSVFPRHGLNPEHLPMIRSTDNCPNVFSLVSRFLLVGIASVFLDS